METLETGNGIQDARWYVVHVYSTYEDKVKSYLETLIENGAAKGQIFEVVVPKKEEIIDRNGKRKVVERKKFPGYVFIKMIHTLEIGYLVLHTRGVTRFVGPSGKPFPLTDDEIIRMGLEERDIGSMDIRIGDTIQVISGAFESNLGTVEKLYPEKVQVVMQLFGRDTPVELDYAQIEKIQPE